MLKSRKQPLLKLKKIHMSIVGEQPPVSHLLSALQMIAVKLMERRMTKITRVEPKSGIKRMLPVQNLVILAIPTVLVVER